VNEAGLDSRNAAWLGGASTKEVPVLRSFFSPSRRWARRGAVARCLLGRLLGSSDVVVPLGCGVVVRALWFFADTRCDPFFPASVPRAAWFVLRHWRWLSSPEGPYAPFGGAR
jgi:hypothetical protein